MLPDEKLRIIQELVSTATKEEIIWLNGYLAGLATQARSAPESRPAVSGKLTIAYGTETGNAKRLATDFATLAKKNGIHAKAVSLDQYRLDDLSKEEYFLTVISTQGEGEPPGAAKKFYDHIHKNGFRLQRMKFGVLALGDTAYPLFCKAGEDIDVQLEKLGGERIVSLEKCDTDFQHQADEWFSGILQQFQAQPATCLPCGTATVKKTSKKSYQGTILSHTNLNDRDSRKKTFHIEIAADGLDYEPGDSIGIVPENDPVLVSRILSRAELEPAKTVLYHGSSYRLGDLLTEKINIAHLAERVIQQYASITRQDIPLTKIGLLELLTIYPISSPEQFEQVLGCLEPITPRLYSISSALPSHAGEVHVTVALDHFPLHEEIKYGLCSGWLAKRKAGEPISFYVHKNAQFRLPSPDRDIIMVGPGTGVAPFRSFLSQRDICGGRGRNWLFFGDHHFTSDFLYQTEIQQWHQTGVLTRIDLAFSRDQPEKRYVQHKMHRRGREIFDWLEKGAYFYVCGSRDPMSTDVEKALLEIIEKNLHAIPSLTAQNYLDRLRESGRYLRDVY